MTTTAVVAEQLLAAMNAHDIDAFVACFHEDYESEQPAHPDRAFRGSDQVRRNWSGIFESTPDFRAELVRADAATVPNGANGAGTGRTPTAVLDMAGVIVAGVRDGRMAWARLYVEPVEREGAGSTPRCARCAATSARRPDPGGGREQPGVGDDVRPWHRRAAQVADRVDALEPAAGEHDALEPHAGELGAAEVAALEADVAQHRLAERGLAQVAVGEHDALEPRGGEAREVDPAAGEGHVAQRGLAEGRAREARLVDRDPAQRGLRRVQVGEVGAGHDRVGRDAGRGSREPASGPRTRHSASVRWRTASSPAPVSSTRLVAGLVLQRGRRRAARSASGTRGASGGRSSTTTAARAAARGPR